MSANLLKSQAMLFCSSPYGFAHHSAKSSRIMISNHGFFIIHLIGTLARGISLLQHCFVPFTFRSRYWNTVFWPFVRRFRKATPWPFDSQYSSLRSIIAGSESTVLTFKRLPSCWIWSEKWFRRCIIEKLKSDVVTRCWAISDMIGGKCSSTRQHFAAGKRLFPAGSLLWSSCVCKVICCVKVSKTFFVDLLAQNRLKTFWWQWNSSRDISMYAIMASDQ